MENYSSQFNALVKEKEFDLSTDEGKENALIAFSEQEPGWFARKWRESANALRGGATSMTTSIVGGLTFLGGRMVGSEGAMSAGADLMAAGSAGAEALSGVTDTEGGDSGGLYYGAVAAAPSLAPVGLGANVAGRGLGALGRIGVNVATKKGIQKGGFKATSKFLAKEGVNIGMTGTAAFQSYSGMLADHYVGLEQEFGEEKAKEMLNSGDGQLMAIAGGLGTMATMKMFPGGKEAVFKGKDLSQSTIRSLIRDAGGAKKFAKALKTPELNNQLGR